MAKTTKTTKAADKAAETRAVAEKAAAEKAAAVRSTALYGRIKAAVDGAIAEAASKGRPCVAFPEVTVPGELGSPDKPIAQVLCECEDTKLVADTLAEDLESEGYKVARLFGCPLAVAWSGPLAE